MDLLFIILGGVFFGLLLSAAWDFFERRFMFQKTKTEAEHVLQESQEKSEILLDKAKLDFETKKHKIFKTFEKEREKYQTNIKEIQSQIDKRSHKLSLFSKELKRDGGVIKSELSKMKNEKEVAQKQTEQINKEFKSKESQLIKKLTSSFSIDIDNLKTNIKKQLEEDWIKEMTEKIEKIEKENSKNLQKNALFHLNVVLNRFERANCLKRTIEPVHFQNLKLLEKVIGPDQKNITELEKECGVDMIVNKEDLLVQVFGIDPVRRELGRMTLANLLKQNDINSQLIKDQVMKSKQKLFKIINRDGKKICKNLKLENVSSEVQNMMGALKYRYSFAQNQYYHCEEAGWLCGLLSSELNLPKDKGKRSGMFHDIGKAMDHSIEGSHAVIGADFLSKHSEKADITHAVRAHHHDETPSTALAYLVISADAISGSRPGARRFTEDSYSKKLASLERIIDSFDNIEDAYIMSAGREMRVIVNNAKINDQEALNLSKKIARQIEKECSYPGLIKVTVVRHSESLSIAK